MKTGTRKRALEVDQENTDFPLAKRLKQVTGAAWKIVDFFNPFKKVFLTALPFTPEENLLKEVQWAHGSTSATLALMQWTDHQLIPYGKLPPFVVPFVGELCEGISFGGINQNGICGVAPARLDYAWSYAMRAVKGPKIESDHLKEDFKKRLEQLLNDPEVIPPCYKIEHLLMSIQKLVLWDKAALQALLKEKKFSFQRAKVRLEKRNDEMAYRIDRLKRLFSTQGWESIQQAVKDKLKGSPAQLFEAIYQAFREMHLFPPVSNKKEKMIHQAQGLADFGGWSSEGLAPTLTCEEWYFQASVAACVYCTLKYSSERYSITHTRFYLQEVLEPRFQTQKRKYEMIFSSLGENASLALNTDQKAFMQQNIPLLFCSTHRNNEEIQETRDSLLWKKQEKGLGLGEDINVLVTDTPPHKQLIEHYLKERDVKNVRVGLWPSRK